MTSLVQYSISFTAKDGSEAQIKGDMRAIERIERMFRSVGIKFNTDVETWDEGYYQQDTVR